MIDSAFDYYDKQICSTIKKAAVIVSGASQNSYVAQEMLDDLFRTEIEKHNSDKGILGAIYVFFCGELKKIK